MSTLSFFDVNGFIGKGVFGNSEYPEPQDLISQMDYLGIDRSIIWSHEARDVCTMQGNKNLLNKISSSKEYRKRLIPAFVINPAVVFDQECLNFLKQSLSSGSVKALRIFPSSSRFNLGTIERLFCEIKEFSPVILWNFMDSNGRTDCTELVELAEQFQQFKFILTDIMWGGAFNNALDMMWRSKNILIDISWLHMTDAIEILVEHFGAERVIFGRGPKSHYGASIAALAHSPISSSDKEKIAHGNMGKLLKINKLKKSIYKTPDIIHKKTIWQEFRSGNPVSEVEIIDSHGHSGSSIFGWTIKTNNLEEMFDAIVSRMDSLGISQIIISHFHALFGEPVAANREFANLLKNQKEKRILGYYAFNPHYKDVLVPDIEKSFSGGFFKGFKLLASYWKVPLTDTRFEPVWEFAHKHCLPILIHTWNDQYNPPEMLKDIVKKYNNALFLLGHAGGGDSGRKEAEKLAMENKNVYLEYCGSFVTALDWVDTFNKLGFNNTVFGSDTYCHDQAWELGRLLSTPVPDEKLIPVLSGNIKKILAKSKL